MGRCSGRRRVKMTIIAFSSLCFEDLFVLVTPGWEQLMALSSVAAALLQGTQLCSYFCSSLRQGLQIISKGIFLWFQSVCRQWMPQFVHRRGRAELCHCRLEQFLREELFSHCPETLLLPACLLAWALQFPWTLWTCSDQTCCFAIIFYSQKNCRPLLLSLFAGVSSCHQPLLLPLQHHAHQAAAVCGGAGSFTILHLKNWSQRFDYNFVALQHWYIHLLFWIPELVKSLLSFLLLLAGS